MNKPVGRPSKYQPEYCEMVIAAARDGKSLTNFASDIDVSRSTITEWVREFPEFSAAVSRAKSHAAAWYEVRARRLADDGGSSAQASMIQFAMKNLDPEGWREVSTKELTGPGGGPVQITDDPASIAEELRKRGLPTALFDRE